MPKWLRKAGKRAFYILNKDKMNAPLLIDTCICCGSNRIVLKPVLWQSLIDEWRLSSHEVEYINHQQGLRCWDCNANLRTMVLATSIMKCFSFGGLFRDFVKQQSSRQLQILEINAAYTLTEELSRIPGHKLGIYPEVDMMSLPYEDGEFDLVVHSDTLEHIEYPVRALSECYRVLRPGGYCCFTVPIIVDRLTISREGLPPSYHGSEGDDRLGYLVHTEYGCDAWKHIIQAGFQECRIHSLDYPSAQALVGVRSQ